MEQRRRKKLRGEDIEIEWKVFKNKLIKARTRETRQNIKINKQLGGTKKSK